MNLINAGRFPMGCMQTAAENEGVPLRSIVRVQKCQATRTIHGFSDSLMNEEYGGDWNGVLDRTIADGKFMNM